MTEAVVTDVAAPIPLASAASTTTPSAPPPAAVRPLDADELALLGAIHTRGSTFGAAEQLGLGPGVIERGARKLQESRGTRLFHGSESDLRLTAEGLALLTASREYHGALQRIRTATDSGAPELATVRMAVIGSRYQHVAACMVRGDNATLLHVEETTAPDAIRMLEAGEVDAAYVWEDADPVPLPGTARREVAVDALAVAIAQPVRAAAGPLDAAALTRLPWVTTPSGEPLVRKVLAAHGKSDPELTIVDCVMTLQGLVAMGHSVSLASPLTLIPASDAVDLVDLPHPMSRTLALLTDETTVPAPIADKLQAALQDAYRTHARQPVLAPDAPATTYGEPAPTRADPPEQRGQLLSADDIAVLAAIQHTGSLNRAAEQLCLSQPALSRRIQRMEARVNARLVQRGRGGSVLTPFARRALDTAQDALQRFERRLKVAPTSRAARD